MYVTGKDRTMKTDLFADFFVKKCVVLPLYWLAAEIINSTLILNYITIG